MADDADSRTAAEVRRLRLTIVTIFVVVVLVGAGWLAYRRANDSGRAKADRLIDCVNENLSSPTSRDC
ncbi:MAG TPA: hypothetical protein VGE38_16810 [Nocardioides sp.]|uniref:hypothetical protein n=1 Tax=Nocardioides sp. TaxID=35761 RepID=UPI002ED9B28E